MALDHPREEARIKELLGESVKNLCAASLTYQSRITIEGTVGIRVDDTHILLVNIQQSVDSVQCGTTEVEEEACANLESPMCTRSADTATLDNTSRSKSPRSKSPKKSAKKKKRKAAKDKAPVDIVQVPSTEDINIINQQAINDLHDTLKVEQDGASSVEKDWGTVRQGTSGVTLTVQEHVKAEVVDVGAILGEDSLGGDETNPQTDEDMDHDDMQMSDADTDYMPEDAHADSEGQNSPPHFASEKVTRKRFKEKSSAATRGKLAEHIQAVISKGKIVKYCCKICSYKAARKYSVQRHLATHGMALYLCQICGKSLPDSVEFTSHVKFAHRKEIIQCKYCDQRFRSRQGYSQHKALHAESGRVNKSFCEICKKQFATPSTYKQHRRAEHEGVSFTCEHCHKTFKYKNSLNTHTCESHPDFDSTVVKVYRCSLCDKQYRRKHTLKDHFDAVHQNKEEFSCEKCGQRFSYRSTLFRHRKKDACQLNVGQFEGRVNTVKEETAEIFIETETPVELVAPTEMSENLTYYVVGDEGLGDFEGETTTIVLEEALEVPFDGTVMEQEETNINVTF